MPEESGWRDRVVEVTRMNPRDLEPNPLNWRTHPEEQSRVLAAVLSDVGSVTQVIWNRRTGHLIDGHLRRDLAVARGDASIPVNVVDLSPEEERTILLAFDPIGAMAEADTTVLAELARQIETDDPVIRAFVDQMLADVPVTSGDADDTPAPDPDGGDLTGPDERDADRLRARWGTAPGQLWRVPSRSATGDHLILVGDATEPADVSRLFAASEVGRAALLVTSPPYWANQEYDRPAQRPEIEAFMRRVASAWATRVDRRIVVQTGSTTTTAAAGKGDQGDKAGRPSVKSAPFAKILLDALWVDAFAGVGWLCRYRRFWLKNGLMLHPGPVSDLVNEGVETMVCLYRPGHNEGGQERVNEDWALAGWWELPGVRGDGHPCPFHPEIARRNVRLYSSPGDRVVDPFLGQGTTIEACEDEGRLGMGTELDPGYAAVALERLSLRGLEPRLVEGVS